MVIKKRSSKIIGSLASIRVRNLETDELRSVEASADLVTIAAVVLGINPPHSVTPAN